MYQAKRMLPLLFLAVLAYLLFANWQLEDTKDLAFATGCSSGGCSAQPDKVSKNPFSHRYVWHVGTSTTDVTCRRGMILIGGWKCKVNREAAAAAEGRDDMRQYPHQTQRGAD